MQIIRLGTYAARDPNFRPFDENGRPHPALQALIEKARADMAHRLAILRHLDAARAKALRTLRRRVRVRPPRPRSSRMTRRPPARPASAPTAVEALDSSTPPDAAPSSRPWRRGRGGGL